MQYDNNMMIEALARWTEMQITPEDPDEAYAKRIISGEEQNPLLQPKFRYDLSPIVFDLRDVARFNRSHDPLYTTLHFKDGDGFIIKYAYKDFQALYIEFTGKTIRSILPLDFETIVKPRKHKPPKSDDLLDGI